jgi:hypothetical protein
MIGRISFDVSFGNKLAYCLRQKQTVREEREQTVSEERKRTLKQNLAEVIYYNQCYGNKQELVRQFKEVRKQNYNIRKPVLHLVLSLPPGEAVSKSLFVDLARDCARALDFERHQYVAILHKDREHPHVHIVANRIGFDRHTMVNQYTLRRMNQFCRESERRYHLTQVRSIRWYRTPDERNIASEHLRVVKLRETLDRELKQCCTLEELKTRLQVQGYRVYKTEQGIAFKDADQVVVRGYKVGHPWKEIDSVLTENERLRQALVLRESQRQTMRRRQRLDDQF